MSETSKEDLLIYKTFFIKLLEDIDKLRDRYPYGKLTKGLYPQLNTLYFDTYIKLTKLREELGEFEDGTNW